jgi:hypothetical protein
MKVLLWVDISKDNALAHCSIHWDVHNVWM